MNIDNLEPGRELDALVAEKVMGIETEWYHYEPKNCYRLVKKGHATDAWSAAMAEADVSSYSTKFGAAMKVVAKIIESDRWELFDIQWSHPDSDTTPKSSWWACFIPFDDDAEWYSGEGDTPALAICRAALKVVEEVS